MYLNEIAPRTKTTMEIAAGEKMIALDSTIAHVTNGADKAVLDGVRKAKPRAQYAVLDPIRRDGKLVSFSGNGVNCNMLAIIDGHDLTIWKNITVLNMRLPVYGSVHVVLSTKEGTPYNRRKSDRGELGCEGTLKIRTTEKETTYAVTILNMSESGVAFSAHEKHGLEKGSGCLIDFSVDGFSFHFDAVVGRIEKANGTYTFACRIRQRSGPVATYISQKKKEQKAQKKEAEAAATS